MSSYFYQQYAGSLVNVVGENQVAGLFIYLGLIIVAIVFAPMTSIPFIPIVVEIWGILWTSIFSVFGWVVGSLIAFWIARKFGAILVKSSFHLKK